MKSQSASDKITTAISSLGVLVSIFSLLVAIGGYLNLSTDLLVALGSVLVTFFVGLFSKQLSTSARKLSTSRRVFLSYSSDLEQSVKEVAEKLRKSGTKVWMDIDRIKPGESISYSIKQAMDDTDTFVVFLSSKQTPWVIKEIEQAQSKKIRIIPVTTDPQLIPEGIRDLKYIKLTDNKDATVSELVKAI
jgi:histidyl-tRNA synthetase